MSSSDFVLPEPLRYPGVAEEPPAGAALTPAVTRHYRTVWISDVHLGMPDCRAEYLLEFLAATRCEQLYLVGDILDLWNMKQGWFWPESHNAVLQTLLARARRDSRVVYIPGNHDEALRELVGTRIGAVEVVADALHYTADGRRLLVLHGDRFDGWVKNSLFLAELGSGAYDLMQVLNRWFNRLRGVFGLPYWSLSGYLKHQVKEAVSYIGRFEEAVVLEARRRGVDGLVCGHIHRANLQDLDGLVYGNDGDWVESCTALVEHHDGRLEVVRWLEERQGAGVEAPALCPLPA